VEEISSLTTFNVNTTAELQAAIEDCDFGDTILLAAGVEFAVDGSFHLTAKGVGTAYITIKGSTATPAVFDTAWPNSYNITNGTFTRLVPDDMTTMPKLIGTSTLGVPVIVWDANAHHWLVEGLAITTDGTSAETTCLIGIGTIPTLDDMPHHITFNKNFLYPAEETGVIDEDIIYRSTESAFIVSGDNIILTNNCVQGFTGYNKFPTPGQYRLNANSFLVGYLTNSTLRNNLLEANGQVFLSGGGIADPAHTATATDCTYTSATLSDTTGLEVGMLIAVQDEPYATNHQTQDSSGAFIDAQGAYVNGRIETINTGTGEVTFTHLTGSYNYRWSNLRLWGATGGTFTLTWMGQTTSALDFDATKTEIQGALESLSNVAPGDFSIVSSADGWPYGDFLINWGIDGSAYEYPTSVDMLVVNSSLTGNTATPWAGGRVGEKYLPLENNASNDVIDIPDDGSAVAWDGFVSDNNLIERNIIAHHPEWTAAVGSVKGFMEIKGGSRTYVNANLFTGEGTGLIFTIRNQGDGGSGPWVNANFSEITNNFFEKQGYALAMFLTDGALQSDETHDILIHNNFFGTPTGSPGHPYWCVLASGYNVSITHNTGFLAERVFTGYGFTPSSDPIVKDNIFRPAGYAAPCFDGAADSCWPDPVASNNLLINNTGMNPDNLLSWGTSFGETPWVETTIAAVEFVAPDSDLNSNGNYRLLPTSPYYAGNARDASDGTNMGVDYDAMITAMQFNPFSGDGASASISGYVLLSGGVTIS